MAKSITLVQYGTVSAQREKNFVSEVDAYMHIMLNKDQGVKKTAHLGRKNASILGLFSYLPSIKREILRLEEEILNFQRDYMNSNVSTAIEATLQKTVSQNLFDLVTAGYGQIFRKKQQLDCSTIQVPLSDQVLLVSDYRSALQRLGKGLDLWSKIGSNRYIHLQKVLEEISRKALSTTPELSVLSNPYRMLENQPSFKRALSGLRRQGYVSKNSSERLLELLLDTPQPPRETRVISVPAAAVREAAVPLQPQRTIEDDPSQRLEYLTNYLKLPLAIAEELVPQLGLNEILETHEKLMKPEYVGEKLSGELIRANPKLLLYRKEGLLSGYLKALKQMQTRIIQHPERESKYGLANNLSAYSRFEDLLELKDRLEIEIAPKQTPAAHTTERSLDLAEYPMLYRGSEKVERRLASLIDEGKVEVDGKEHAVHNSDGPRGRNILILMRQQLTGMFVDMGYSRPRMRLNYGQVALSISEEDQDRLREIRDVAYGMQEKKQ